MCKQVRKLMNMNSGKSGSIISHHRVTTITAATSANLDTRIEQSEVLYKQTPKTTPHIRTQFYFFF